MKQLSKKLSLILIAIMIAAALTGCGNFASEEGSKNTEFQRFEYYFDDCFDTGISLIAYCKTQEEFDEIAKFTHDTFVEIHKCADIYNKYDDMENAALLNETKHVSIEKSGRLYFILSMAQGIYVKTQGATNVALGNVLRVWHTVREESRNMSSGIELPNYESLLELAEHSNCMDIKFSKENIYIDDPELTVDLGAVAKGYATNFVGNSIKTIYGVDFLLNSGGNCYASGRKADGKKWAVGIQDPDNLSGGYVEIVELENACVATSGDYFRYFTDSDGKKYCHIIDPETLMPADKYRSVTVIGSDAGMCDALSTALFVQDIESGRKTLEKCTSIKEQYSAMWILPDGSVEYAGGFEDYIRN